MALYLNINDLRNVAGAFEANGVTPERSPLLERIKKTIQDLHFTEPEVNEMSEQFAFLHSPSTEDGLDTWEEETYMKLQQLSLIHKKSKLKLRQRADQER